MHLSFTTPPTSYPPSHCPQALLCQSYRGLEWAWSSLDASDIILSGFRLQFSTAVRVYSSSLQPRHPRLLTAASHQLLISSRHSASSSPSHRAHDAVSPSPPQRSASTAEPANRRLHIPIHNRTQPQRHLLSPDTSEQCIWSIGSEW